MLCVAHVLLQVRGSGLLGDNRHSCDPALRPSPELSTIAAWAPLGQPASQQQLHREVGKPSPVAQGSLLCTASPELRRGVREASAAVLLQPSLSSGWFPRAPIPALPRRGPGKADLGLSVSAEADLRPS